ncbi:MAG: glycosyltransferase family 9 protein [Bacteroidales bacterium]|nr:glycosyltransferase family 9 protein [Bacteroidales bacterium]
MKRIILSRTDSIGDVLLTLPLAGVLKKYFPHINILFLGRSYTRPVIEACSFVDEFIDWDPVRTMSYRDQVAAFKAFRADAIIHVFMVGAIAKLADAADIPVKVGTTHRLFSWLYCNKLVWFSRRQSDLHEAQLNLKLLKPLGVEVMLERERIPDYYGLTTPKSPKGDLLPPLQRRVGEGSYGSQFKLILHPKSKGSAREWGLENFSRLIELLPKDRFNIYITGTKEEGEMMNEFLKKHRDEVTNMTGKMNLQEFMDFIRECDGLVAASTGPLHLAAAFGKVAIGLYAPMRPIYPTRWAPLGAKASYFVAVKECNDCRKTMDCHCMKEIRAEEVAERLMFAS